MKAYRLPVRYTDCESYNCITGTLVPELVCEQYRSAAAEMRFPTAIYSISRRFNVYQNSIVAAQSPASETSSKKAGL